MDFLSLVVVEKLGDVAVRQVVPRLHKGQHVVEPGNLEHGVAVGLTFVLLPKAPLLAQGKALVDRFFKAFLLRGSLYYDKVRASANLRGISSCSAGVAEVSVIFKFNQLIGITAEHFREQ